MKNGGQVKKSVNNLVIFYKFFSLFKINTQACIFMYILNAFIEIRNQHIENIIYKSDDTSNIQKFERH